MSRVAHLLLAAALLAAPPAGVLAQTATPQLPAESADDTAREDVPLAERLLVSPREPRCDDNGQIGGIQVCGKKKDNSKDRLPIPGELNAATATGDGLPRAPDTMGNRITGKSIKFSSCLIGGCPRALMPDINFSLLPPAPLGSDADRMGRGEIRGN